MRKVFLIFISLISITAFAEDATSALKNIIPLGSHLGTDDAGNPCQVTLTATNNFAEVKIESELLILTKKVYSHSDFFKGRLGNQNVLFFQDDKITNPSDDTEFTEYSIRITNADENKISVSVGKLIVNNRDVKNYISSCNI